VSKRQRCSISSVQKVATPVCHSALRFIVDRKIPLKKIFTHRFKLEEADQAYRLFDTQTTGKGVFLF